MGVEKREEMWNEKEEIKAGNSQDHRRSNLVRSANVREVRHIPYKRLPHPGSQRQKVKKGLWSPEEDEKLIRHITKYGKGCWSSVPKQAGLQRCGKSCRLRWVNYLRPDLKRGTFSPEEEKLIINLQAELGNRWSQIATQLPGRTDNEIKNFWNSCIRKKLMEMCTSASTQIMPLIESTPREGSGKKTDITSDQYRNLVPGTTDNCFRPKTPVFPTTTEEETIADSNTQGRIGSKIYAISKNLQTQLDMSNTDCIAQKLAQDLTSEGPGIGATEPKCSLFSDPFACSRLVQGSASVRQSHWPDEIASGSLMYKEPASVAMEYSLKHKNSKLAFAPVSRNTTCDYTKFIRSSCFTSLLSEGSTSHEEDLSTPSIDTAASCMNRTEYWDSGDQDNRIELKNGTLYKNCNTPWYSDMSSNISEI
eukprot:Gb_24641 [translate_table: standard]